MSRFAAAKARRVLAALLRIGWSIKRQSGSHKTLAREGFPDFVFAFHDDEELGPRHALAHRQAHRPDAGRLVSGGGRIPDQVRDRRRHARGRGAREGELYGAVFARTAGQARESREEAGGGVNG